jgi:hypothetical protein
MLIKNFILPAIDEVSVQERPLIDESFEDAILSINDINFEGLTLYGSLSFEAKGIGRINFQLSKDLSDGMKEGETLEILLKEIKEDYSNSTYLLNTIVNKAIEYLLTSGELF